MQPPVWTYRYAVFDPREPPPGEADPARTFGVEMTVVAHQRVCGLGNLDPQHTGGDAGTAAVEAALSHPLPPAGSLLATNRADLDALAAMAVLQHRARHGSATGLNRARIEEIAAADGARPRRWPGPQPVEPARLAPGDRQVLAHLAGDAHVAVADRVEAVCAWLADGAVPTDADRRRESITAETAAALADSEVSLGAASTIAVVVSAHRLAFSVGYRHAPLVIAAGPAPQPPGDDDAAGRKVTIGQYEPGWADLDAAAADLNRLEAHARSAGELARTWGGQPTIKGSPQGVGTLLPLEDIIAIVQGHLRQVVGQ